MTDCGTFERTDGAAVILANEELQTGGAPSNSASAPRSRPALAAEAVIADLLDDALSLFETNPRLARSRIEQAYGLARRPDRADPPVRGGLAAWQARRAEAYVGENLASGLSVEAAAAVVRLSTSHFSRAFKATFGVPFSHYVIRRRVELAKRLLLTTDAAIADIAIACGLADQSHLTRVFSRAVGSPPNAWRRRMREHGLELPSAA